MDLRKSLTTTQQPKDGEDKKSLAGALQRAATGTALRTPQRVDSRAIAVSRGTGTIGYVIDATGSRAAAWVEAQKIQRQMFQSALQAGGGMSLRLIHFGGDKVTAHEWESSPAAIAAKMAGVSCLSGSTQFIPSFAILLSDPVRPASVIMIGDSFEEDAVDMINLAHELAKRGIKVFAFHEGDDDGAAHMFKQIAEITGGAFSKFGKNMPLNDLCRAVTVYTVGGRSALDRLIASGDAAAKTIGGDHKRLGGPQVK